MIVAPYTRLIYLIGRNFTKYKMIFGLLKGTVRGDFHIVLARTSSRTKLYTKYVKT